MARFAPTIYDYMVIIRFYILGYSWPISLLSYLAAARNIGNSRNISDVTNILYGKLVSH